MSRDYDQQLKDVRDISEAMMHITKILNSQQKFMIAEPDSPQEDQYEAELREVIETACTRVGAADIIFILAAMMRSVEERGGIQQYLADAAESVRADVDRIQKEREKHDEQ